MREKDFYTRHSKSPTEADPESRNYPGISVEGEKLAKARAKDILASLDVASDGTVMFIGGGSDLVRTKSTALAYGDGIKQLLTDQQREDVVVIMPTDVEKISGLRNKVKFIVEQIQTHPGKKFVIDMPLSLKEVSITRGFTNREGTALNAYSEKLLKHNDNDYEKALHAWLRGDTYDGLAGPDPKDVADQHEHAIERLRNFAKRFVPDRPIIIGGVGHSWILDALAVSLANNGEIDEQKYQAIRNAMIGYTELVQLNRNADGGLELRYGEEHIPLDLPPENHGQPTETKDE